MPSRSSLKASCEHDRVWLAGALVLPLSLVVVILAVFGEGYGCSAVLTESGGLPAAVLVFLRALANVYFPGFIVAGSTSPVMALFGLYLIFAVIFTIRRRWAMAAVVLLLPIALSWLFCYALLRD